MRQGLWTRAWPLLVTALLAAEPTSIVLPKQASKPSEEEQPIAILPAVVLPEHRHPLVEAEADFLLWWMRTGNTPVLATTSTQPGATDFPLPGTLGQPDTRILFGGPGALNFNEQGGLRAFVTYYPMADGPVGIQLGGMLFGRSSVNYRAASNNQGLPVIAQPLTFVGEGPGALPVAIGFLGPNPGLSGTLSEAASSRLFGYEINAVHHYRKMNGYPQIHSLAGFRVLGLQESLVETTQVGGILTLRRQPVESVRITDDFRANTYFYGAQVGVRSCWSFSQVSVDVWGKLAVGLSQQQLILSGESVGSNGDRAAGGVRVLASNAGCYTFNDFAILPELGVNLGYALTEQMRLRVGYNFLYLSKVVRPGDHIDTTVDTRLIPSSGSFDPTATGTRPALSHKPTDFWAHGLNFGVEVQF